MKKSIYISILFAFLAIHTISSQSAIKGEGDVVKKEITLSNFDGIQLSIDANVVLSQGKVQKVVIEGQQNIIDNIEKEVRGGSWSIEYDKHVKSAKPVTIYITLSKISDIAFSGSGSISTNGKFTGLGDLDIAMSGSGDIQLEVDASDIDLAMSGSGDVDLSGSGKSMNIAISGSGNVDATSLPVSGCAVAISGSGDVLVNVNGDLEVAISGSGNVKYKGDANVESWTSGSGSVSKM